MPISSFNIEKLDSLNKVIIDLETQLHKVINTTEKEFLLNDIKNLI